MLDHFSMRNCRTKGALVIIDCCFKIVDSNGHMINFGKQHIVSLTSTEVTKVFFANFFSELWIINTHALAWSYA